MAKVTVLLNASPGSFFGYEPGMELHEAISYETGAREPLDDAFEMFNIGNGDLAREYRAGRNRSLSVGDVVVVDGVAHACASFGWDELPEVPPVEPGPWYEASLALRAAR